MNPDGAWVTPRLHALDASDNGIGKEGLWAFARAVDPKCARCLRGYGWSRRNSVADFGNPAGAGGRSGPGSGPGSPGTPDAVPGCWPAAAASGGPSGESSPRISPRSRSCRLSRCTSRCTSPRPGAAHGGSLLLTALTRDAAHAAVATKLMGSVGITNGSTGGTTSRSDSPDSRFGGGGSDCAFDVRSGLRRLNLARNDPDESVAEAFAAMRAPGGRCAVRRRRVTGIETEATLGGRRTPTRTPQLHCCMYPTDDE